MEIYQYLTTTQNYLIGCGIVALLCLIMLFCEKKKLKKVSVTFGDIIIYVVLSALSWYGLIVATIVCFITNTEWMNKPIIRF